MTSKRVVFVIVEGPSDDEALGLLLTRFFDDNQVYVHIVHGDITSDRTVNPQNISKKITEFVRQYAKSAYLLKSDFQEVIQIVDTDGAFIPDSQVVRDDEKKRPYYTTSQILCANPEQIIQRNHQKSQNLRKISTLSKVWKDIHYRVFYMSSNLDHVLHDKLNCSDEEKENDAHYFAKSYRNRLDEFVLFMTDSEFSVCEDYKASWEFIKQGNHSLERYSNLGILFKKDTPPLNHALGD
jgi:hypothetical protein